MNVGEMFAGIGGFRLGLERANSGLAGNGQEDFRLSGRQTSIDGTGNDNPQAKRPDGCLGNSASSYRVVWANELDKYACQIYRKNFGDKELVEGDIREVKTTDIPDFDLLCAGFPCQSFSLAGKRQGTTESRGTLFAQIVRVAHAKRPRLLLLENVKGLLSSDNGGDFAKILRALGNLGYLLEWQVFNSKYFGVPQNRERVFIVGHLREGGFKQIFPIESDGGEAVSESIGEDGEGPQIAWSLRERDYKDGTNFVYWKNSQSGWVNEQREDCLALKGQGDLCRQPLVVADRSRSYAELGRNLESPKPYSNALSGVQKDNLVIANCLDQDGYLRTGARPRDENGKPQLLPIGHRRIRRLTPIECERLQGFPDNWTQGVSDTQRYKLLGNAVTVNVIQFLGELIVSTENIMENQSHE